MIPHRTAAAGNSERRGENSMGMKVIWNNVGLAESDDTKKVEGNHYFPLDSLNREYFKPNTGRTVCPWKGVTSYYDIEVDGELRRSGVWYYPDPCTAARQIKDHLAFYTGRGLKVVNSDAQAGDSFLKRIVDAILPA